MPEPRGLQEVRRFRDPLITNPNGSIESWLYSTQFSNDLDIFLCGKMCAGKDYIADVLVEQAGFVKLPFALPLKQEVADKHGITLEELNANKNKYRAELQELGGARRAENPSYWIEKWINARHEINNPVVCTDCRHVNEAAFGCTSFTGFVVKVHLSETTRLNRIKTLYGEVPDKLHEHPSEVEVDRCPFHLEFPGTCYRSRIFQELIVKVRNHIDRGLHITVPCSSFVDANALMEAHSTHHDLYV
jgi:hypothetical protein